VAINRHFQLLRYLLGAWDIQIKQHKAPFMTIPIVLYHGQEKWEEETFDSYFGGIDQELLRFLPCFDYVLINLQKYSDATIRAIESIFLQKSLLVFKYYLDKTYLKLHLYDLLISGLAFKKDDETESFLRKLGVYLSNISGMTSDEIIEEIIKFDDNLNPQAMSIFEVFEEKGIEKGIEKEKYETIIRSWKNGIEISMIANITGLAIAEIEKVIADFQSKK
jgi:hypothetical protein